MSKIRNHYVVQPSGIALPQKLQGYFNVAPDGGGLDCAVLYQSNELCIGSRISIELTLHGYTRFFEQFWLPTETTSDDRRTLVQALFAAIAVTYDTLITHDHNIHCYEQLYAYALHRIGNLPARVLDFGCGTGLITHTQFVKDIPKLKGFDSCHKMAAIADARGLEVMTIPLHFIASMETFDVILASYVFHYGLTLEDWRSLLACVANNGMLLGNFHKGIGLDQALGFIENLGSDYNCEVSKSPFGPILAVSVTHQSNILC